MTTDIGKIRVRISKAHRNLMRYPETAPYSGIMMMGTSKVLPDEEFPKGAPCTAYTDGVNKFYGATYTASLTQPQVAGLIMHENLHIALKHLSRNLAYWEEDSESANIAADYVVNAIIAKYDPDIVVLPPGALYDPKYDGWSFGRVYADLRKQSKQGGGSGSKPSPLDSHHMFGVLNESEDGGDEEQTSKIEQQIDNALREGALLAGRLKASLPRAVTDSLVPEVDWVQETRQFVSASMAGRQEYTWRQFDRRRLANGYYCPSIEDETVGDLAVFIDCSGSTLLPRVWNRFVGELVSLCHRVRPERLRVVYWDTEVQAVQNFTEREFDSIKSLIRPVGGGGTRVGCINDYVMQNSLRGKMNCAVVFTDGYVESSFDWQMPCPTLWLVTENEMFVPPVGKVLRVS